MEITVRKGTVTNTFGPNGAIGTGAGLAPGMSGGPVVLGNSRCVVGIVTAGANYSGFDWFTPTTLAKPLLDVPPAQFVTEAVGRPAVCDDTKSKRYFLERGGAYLAGHDWDRAIDIYNQAIALYPKEVDFFKDRGEAHLENRDYDAAIKDYDAAISLDPHYAEHYYNRGQAYFGNHDYEAAIKNYDAAISLNYDNAASAYYWRGLAKQRNCDSAGGQADIAKARKIDPNVGK